MIFFFSFPAAVAAVSDIADQANDSLKDGVSVIWIGLYPQGFWTENIGLWNFRARSAPITEEHVLIIHAGTFFKSHWSFSKV